MATLSPSTWRIKPLAALIALGCATPVLAQEQQSDAKDDNKGLETIVVKAQKRAQNLQEVPVSVTAFTGDEMAEAVIKDLYDLRTNVPALGTFQTQSATNSSFSIRGIGTSSQNFGLESSVGMYIDGVYRARQNSMINNLVDVAAVEVLRGPQGTLFGKNTPSGAILIRTVAPSHDGDDGFIEGTIGTLGLVNLAAASSISAIEDVLAFRVTAFGSMRDGLVSDVNLGDDTINDRDRFGGRLQALYTPSDDLSVRVIADYAKINEICCGAPVQLSNEKALGVPGRSGTDALLRQLGGTILPDGDSFYEYKVALNYLPKSTMQDQGLSAEVNYQINESTSFVSISGYRNFESFDHIDGDFSDVDLLSLSNDSTQRSFSQELRIDYSGEDVNAIVGAYYFTQDLDLDYRLTSGEDLNEFYMSNFMGQLDPLLGGINFFAQNTGGAIAPAAEAAPGGAHFDHIAKQEHESYAVFAQVDYQLTEKLTLTAGLRYTDESKTLSTEFFERMPGGTAYPTAFGSVGDPTDPSTIVPGTLLYGAGFAGAVLTQLQSSFDFSSLAGQQAFAAFLRSPQGQGAMQALVPFQSPGWGFKTIAALTQDRPDIHAKLDDDQITGTLKLSYQPNRDTMVYYSYGTGYKSGGTNTDRIALGLDPVFKAETSTSHEVGLKADFPEQNVRINTSLYSAEVDDFQANTFAGVGFNLQNAGVYEVQGLELEALWLATDDLEVKLAYAHTNAKYKEFARGNCWNAYEFHYTADGQPAADPGASAGNAYCDRKGGRPEGEPIDYAVLSLKQSFEPSEGVYAYFQAEYSYFGDMILDGSDDPLVKQEAYGLLNMRLYFNFEEYDTDLIFWGRNVLDEEYIGGTNFNTPLQTGKINGFVSEPATFGVTVKKRF